jgi:glycosyltransferase involved in cell wall biosynthesis
MEVAVVIPVRTPSPFLGAALEGVLGQEPAPAEVLVVDDASAQPLELEPGHRERCRLMRLPSSNGPPGARQAGLEASTAELIAVCDDDDVWEPGKLAAQLDALSRHPAAAVCFGRATVIGPDGHATGERWAEPAAGLHDAAALAELLFEANQIPYSTVLVRRTALEAVGGFAGPLSYCEDWDIWLRMVAAGESFVCEPRARIRYRRHPGGMTADTAALAEACLLIHERHAALADPDTRRRVRARDLTALGRARVRQRRYRDARRALGEAASLQPPGLRERLLRALLAVPGPRAALGRRSPYPG